jgi:hypothetical protein
VLTIVATESLDGRHSGLAAGLLNTATQLGGGIGLGIAATIVAAATPPTEVTGQALRLGFLTCVVFSLLALVLVRSGLRPATPDARHAPARTAAG